MFPLRDHNPSGSTPYVTYALIALNVLVYFSMSGWQDLTFFEFALIPARLSFGEGYFTLLTSTFLHAGLLHLAGNMLFLWIFGDNLEDKMGALPFLGFYLACGAGSGLAHMASAPQSMVPTVGASGAIAGVMGGYLLLFPKARVDVLILIKIVPMPAWIMLGLWFALQLFRSFGVDAESGGVAYWAHSGGFVIGLVLSLPVFLRLGGPAFWDRSQGRPPHPEARYRISPSIVPKVPRKRR